MRKYTSNEINRTDAFKVHRDLVMRISKLPVYISLVLATLVFAQLAAGQQVSVANVITGKVVDKNGKAIEGAWVIDTSKETSDATEQLFIGGRTDSNGRFRIEHTWKAGKRVYLEVETPSRAFTYYPITPPYWQGQIEAYPSLASVPLEVSGEPTQDVGTITIDRHFPTVALKLVRKGSQEPLDPKLIPDETFLIFFDNKRNWVALDEITTVRYEAGVNIEDFSITIGLPPGEWIVALCKETKCNTSFGETKSFRVNASDKEKVVVLEVDP